MSPTRKPLKAAQVISWFLLTGDLLWVRMGAGVCAPAPWLFDICYYVSDASSKRYHSAAPAEYRLNVELLEPGVKCCGIRAG